MNHELKPTSDEEMAVLISNDYVSQVRNFGALGYTVERICNLLGLTRKQRMALSMRMVLPGDVYNDAYTQGKVIGEYNIDAELAKRAEAGDIDSIEALESRKQERIELDLRHKLFGI